MPVGAAIDIGAAGSFRGYNSTHFHSRSPRLLLGEVTTHPPLTRRKDDGRLAVVAAAAAAAAVAVAACLPSTLNLSRESP